MGGGNVEQWFTKQLICGKVVLRKARKGPRGEAGIRRLDRDLGRPLETTSAKAGERDESAVHTRK